MSIFGKIKHGFEKAGHAAEKTAKDTGKAMAPPGLSRTLLKVRAKLSRTQPSRR